VVTESPGGTELNSRVEDLPESRSTKQYENDDALI
jgi:hypothetical protein